MRCEGVLLALFLGELQTEQQPPLKWTQTVDMHPGPTPRAAPRAGPSLGIPAVAQCVKNLIAMAQVAAVVRSPAQCSGLKDQVLPQLQGRLQLWLGFNPQPRNLHMLWV